MNARTAALAKYIASLLLFGSNGIVAASIALASYEIVLIRTAIGSTLLIGLFLLARERLTVLHNRRDLLCMAASGVSTGVSWIFLYEAYQRVGVGVSSLVYYCGPIIVMAVSPLLFKERLTTRKLACFAVVLLGTALVNGVVLRGGGDVVGLAYAAASAVAHAFMVIFNKLASKTSGLENPMLQLVLSFLTVAVYTAVVRDFLFPVTANDWPALLFLGLVNTGLGCYLYFSSLAPLPAQTVVMLGYLEPLSAVVLAVILLGEPMSAAQAVGAALILGGALAAEAASSSKRQQAETPRTEGSFNEPTTEETPAEQQRGDTSAVPLQID